MGWVLPVTAVFGVLTAAIGMRFAQLGAFSKSIPTNDESSCRVYRGGLGIEDLGVMRLSTKAGDNSDRTFVFASSDSRLYMSGLSPVSNESARDRIARLPASEQGFIAVMDMSLPPDQRKLSRVAITNYPNGRAFLPHGVSIARDAATGVWHFLVISHNADADHVNVFHVKFGASASALPSLEWQYSVAHPLLDGLNDVAFYDATSFYVTQFHSYAPGSAMGIFEILWNGGWTKVLYCKHAKTGGHACSVALDGLKGANGVNVVGSTVYVAELFASNLLVCSRSPVSGALTVRQTIALGTGPDNIEFQPESNRLLIACHPIMVLGGAAAQDATRQLKAPAQVIALALDPKTGDVVNPTAPPRELFLSGGQKLSAASVGVVIGSELMLGTFVADDGVLICTGNFN